MSPKPSSWEDCFKVNVLDTMHLLKTANAAGIRGAIVAGSCAEYGSGGLRYDYIPVDAHLEPKGAYASSKAALLTYTKSLSRKLAHKKIRVNMVSPGNILFPGGNWDKKKRSNPKIVKQMLLKKVPLQMFGVPEDIGNVVAFLISSKARFITGTNIIVDGGQLSSMGL